MIQLTKDLVMIADDHCYIVGTVNTKRGDGAQRGCKASLVLNPTYYYTTAGQAVQGALNRAMRAAVKDGRITTLSGFIRELERLQVEFEKLVAQLDGGE